MVEPQIPGALLYTRDHHWMKLEGNVAAFGITDHAQNELGDLVLVKLPEVGMEYHAADEIGEFESVKTSVELYAPLSGEVIEVNEALEGTPDLINHDPYGQGWLARIRLTDPSEVEDLLPAEDYGHLVQEGE